MTDVKITSIRCVPLLRESPKGGWSNEIAPGDSIHAIVAVHTDAGITGYGSVFTDGRLAEAAIAVLESLWRGESAIEPQRVSEKLHQNTFWMGRGGTLTMPSAASTSRCGTSSARSSASRWGACLAEPTAGRSCPIARC